MIMNLQLFAMVAVTIYASKGLRFNSTGYKVTQKNLQLAEGSSTGVDFYADEYAAFDNIRTVGNVYDTDVIQRENGTYRLTIDNPSGENLRIYLEGKTEVRYFKVTEPVDIVINGKKVSLLQTIQPSYGKTGAVNGLIERAPYELEMNDVVKSLINQGILIETESPT